MKYKVHRMEVTKDYAQAKLEQFINQLEGEVISIIPYTSPIFLWMGATSKVAFLLIVERIEKIKD